MYNRVNISGKYNFKSTTCAKNETMRNSKSHRIGSDQMVKPTYNHFILKDVQPSQNQNIGDRIRDRENKRYRLKKSISLRSESEQQMKKTKKNARSMTNLLTESRSSRFLAINRRGRDERDLERHHFQSKR